MKTLIFCVAVVGATSCTGGQVTSTPLTGITYAPSTKITASDITYDEAAHHVCAGAGANRIGIVHDHR